MGQSSRSGCPYKLSHPWLRTLYPGVSLQAFLLTTPREIMGTSPNGSVFPPRLEQSSSSGCPYKQGHPWLRKQPPRILFSCLWQRPSGGSPIGGATLGSGKTLFYHPVCSTEIRARRNKWIRDTGISDGVHKVQPGKLSESHLSHVLSYCLSRVQTELCQDCLAIELFSAVSVK